MQSYTVMSRFSGLSRLELAKSQTFAVYAGVMDQKVENLMSALLLAFVLAVCLLASGFAVFGGPAAAARAAALEPGGPVLVIAPPWGQGAAALILAAGGRIVGPVTAPFGALGGFDGPPPRTRLMALGAWAVRDAAALAAICGGRA